VSVARRREPSISRNGLRLILLLGEKSYFALAQGMVIIALTAGMEGTRCG
jgi:hypothetical protein